MSKYAVIHIVNSTVESTALYVQDPDGFEHMVTVLAPGQETDQFTHLKATWDQRPIVAAGSKPASASDQLSLDQAGKGGDKVIGG